MSQRELIHTVEESNNTNNDLYSVFCRYGHSHCNWDSQLYHKHPLSYFSKFII